MGRVMMVILLSRSATAPDDSRGALKKRVVTASNELHVPDHSSLLLDNTTIFKVVTESVVEAVPCCYGCDGCSGCHDIHAAPTSRKLLCQINKHRRRAPMNFGKPLRREPEPKKTDKKPRKNRTVVYRPWGRVDEQPVGRAEPGKKKEEPAPGTARFAELERKRGRDEIYPTRKPIMVKPKKVNKKKRNTGKSKHDSKSYTGKAKSAADILERLGLRNSCFKSSDNR
eukprot:gnl/MRDRNA2_/MRDRNA2_139631_c0_seq1.p1 gnl/MRDRNA2_/MRDRNA2_139631_c0~~gnl/MRDRNA2_/MRDRNA2_139631_c0_seq1.p1  ORF type:complete len:227 (+),score=32.85 gnl/MRDRNA2_/MRDRNA2_139631_c0_seq1:158-838(+)